MNNYCVPFMREFIKRLATIIVSTNLACIDAGKIQLSEESYISMKLTMNYFHRLETISKHDFMRSTAVCFNI